MLTTVITKPCLRNLRRRTSLKLRLEPRSNWLGLNFPKSSKKWHLQEALGGKRSCRKPSETKTAAQNLSTICPRRLKPKQSVRKIIQGPSASLRSSLSLRSSCFLSLAWNSRIWQKAIRLNLGAKKREEKAETNTRIGCLGQRPFASNEERRNVEEEGWCCGGA